MHRGGTQPTSICAPAPCSQSLPHQRGSQFSGSNSVLRRRKDGGGAPRKRLPFVLCQAELTSPWVAGERAPDLRNKWVPGLRPHGNSCLPWKPPLGPQGDGAAFTAAFVSLQSLTLSSAHLCPGTQAPCFETEPGWAPPSSCPNLASPFLGTPHFELLSSISIGPHPDSIFPSLILRPKRGSLDGVQLQHTLAI